MRIYPINMPINQDFTSIDNHNFGPKITLSDKGTELLSLDGSDLVARRNASGLVVRDDGIRLVFGQHASTLIVFGWSGNRGWTMNFTKETGDVDRYRVPFDLDFTIPVDVSPYSSVDISSDENELGISQLLLNFCPPLEDS